MNFHALRDTNAHRVAQGREKIQRGLHYYGTETEATGS